MQNRIQRDDDDAVKRVLLLFKVRVIYIYDAQVSQVAGGVGVLSFKTFSLSLSLSTFYRATPAAVFALDAKIASNTSSTTLSGVLAPLVMPTVNLPSGNQFSVSRPLPPCEVLQEILLFSVSILSAVSTQKEVMFASSEISCKCEVFELLKPPTIIMMSGFSSTNL